SSDLALSTTNRTWLCCASSPATPIPRLPSSRTKGPRTRRSSSGSNALSRPRAAAPDGGGLVVAQRLQGLRRELGAVGAGVRGRHRLEELSNLAERAVLEREHDREPGIGLGVAREMANLLAEGLFRFAVALQSREHVAALELEPFDRRSAGSVAAL